MKNISEIVKMKENVKISFEEFAKAYGKPTKGIKKLKTEILISNDLNDINQKSSKLFASILTSLSAKKRNKGM